MLIAYKYMFICMKLIGLTSNKQEMCILTPCVSMDYKQDVGSNFVHVLAFNDPENKC